MMGLKEKMRRYLFPTYEESMSHVEQMQQLGIKRLKAVAGFDIGDTVYIEGKLRGTIAEVYADPAGYIPSLSIRVKTDGKEAAAYTGIREYAIHSWVMFPCTLSDIQKESSHD